MKAKGFPIALTITTAIALAILIGLGVWQLQRLKWKEGVLAQRAALENAPARPLATVLALADPSSLDMVRVSLDCPGIANQPAQRVFSLAEGEIVDRLISACPSPDPRYDVILVDRGRVPEKTAIPANGAGPSVLVGVLRKPDMANGVTRLISPAAPTPAPGEAALWMGHDIAGIAKALGKARPAPVYVAAETSSNPNWPDLTPGLSTEPIANRHLEYALTWFGLAGALISIYAAMLRRRLKAP